MVMYLSNKITDITLNINCFNLKNYFFYSDKPNLKTDLANFRLQYLKLAKFINNKACFIKNFQYN